MPTPSLFSPFKSSRALLFSTAICALFAAAVGARTIFTVPAGLPTRAEQGQGRGTPVEAEVVTLTPHGFEPAEITRPAGPFVLTLDNRSGLESFTFRVETEGGVRVKEVRVAREDLDWNGVLDPPPGAYTITEADHPGWVCRVSIR